ncbi:MAG: hypothetical protein JO022_00850, partial [Acidobacteriaceae bacterium]|nr:hypothetical protein [Acidobacteriaceae bacterium]
MHSSELQANFVCMIRYSSASVRSNFSFINRFRSAVAVAGLLAGACVASADPTLLDNSFESINVGTPGYVYAPLSTAWSFSPTAGVAATGQPGFAAWFTATPPDGSQAGFLQSNTATISQNLTGLNVGDYYEVSFYAAGRPQYAPNEISVSLGLSPMADITPTSTDFVKYTSYMVPALSTSETLTFTGNSMGDSDTAIDDITISDLGLTCHDAATTPEP